MPHVHRDARQDDPVEPVVVHPAERHAAGDAEPAEDRRQDPARSAVAQVVDADVVLVRPAPPEHVPVAAGDVVLLEHQHLAPAGREVPGGHQPADPGADHDHVPVPLDRRGRFLSRHSHLP